MITKFGKRFLTSYLAGNNNLLSKELAFGIGSTAANAKGNDTRLDFEFYRVPVELSSIDISQTGVDLDGDPVFEYSVIYKSTIPQDISGVISEIALYPGNRQSINNYDSKFITSFTNNFNWFSGSENPTSQSNTQDSSGSYTFLSKIGDTMVRVDATSGSTKEDFTPASGTGDKVQSLSLNNLFSNYTASPNLPDPSSITKIGVEVTATGGNSTVYFDGIRINDEDTFDPAYGMISRSVLSTPLIKKPGRPVDIEYKLLLEF